VANQHYSVVTKWIWADVADSAVMLMPFDNIKNQYLTLYQVIDLSNNNDILNDKSYIDIASLCEKHKIPTVYTIDTYDEYSNYSKYYSHYIY
jgi:hypothetical protein